MNLDEYERAETILAYCPVNNEVDTSLLLEDCISEKHLTLPKTDTITKVLTPCLVDSLADLNEGSYHIMEPNDSCEEILLDKIDIVIIPLVVFDKKGTRLGYGGGYYDRLLIKMKNAKKIGIAFSIQEVEQIQKEEHDVNLDLIITEKKTFKL